MLGCECVRHALQDRDYCSHVCKVSIIVSFDHAAKDYDVRNEGRAEKSPKDPISTAV